MTTLQEKTVAFLTAPEGVERVELTHPWDAVADAGARPELLSTQDGEVQTYDHLDKAEARTVDRLVADVSVDDYDALVLPGGVANPDALRMDETAVRFVRDFVASGKPVAAICHAGWMLAEAEVVADRRVTSWPSLETDLRNAGADWVDEPLVTDGNLITSRKPDDLPGFTNALLESLAHGAAGTR
ncbi:type 1 glutamine amidotransferase domain-containing protein [Marmoricola sp. RAF53]|uniref:type 1 glutamine amidotransferase domain-containing protein n=1 Tax=Marmoricola sp. RAF53 TaxID=3233059 RepID=UPI003F9D8C73